MTNKKPVMTMLCGLPASGKSVCARQLAQETNATIFSSDELREEMFGNVNDQEHNHELFVELHRRIKDCLRSGRSAIYDACNISSKRRMAFLQELKYIDCTKKCIIMATPYRQCLENNKKRDRKVPEHVIKRMYTHWNTPYWFDGWDNIEIHYWENIVKQTAVDWALKYLYYEQDNTHHRLTLGGHCVQAAFNFVLNECINSHLSKVLLQAALVHDCGKPFVKKFENAKREPTKESHYYLHENVGAYDSLFFEYTNDVNPLDISILINLHMQPYNWERQDKETELKLRNKYRKLWGDSLFESVIMLHKADVAAH